MAASSRDANLSSTPRWVVALSGTFVARTVVWGIIVVALGAPALHFVPLAYPSAAPYLWLGTAGFLVALVDPSLPDGDRDVLSDVIEELNARSRREKSFYVTTFAMLLVGGVSFELAAVGVGATLVALYTDLGVLAVAVALWYPSVDSWAGRHLGWNVAAVGGFAALLVMQGVAILCRISPSIPLAAATDLRKSLTVQ